MIYIVNGAPGCGKTTFENLCTMNIRFSAAEQISTVDFVKDVAKFCGWNGKKTPENRKFLSDLKALLTEWDNVPYKRVIWEIEQSIRLYHEHDYGDNDYAIFVDCREPEEITKLKVALGAKTILIRRESAEEIEASNRSDKEVLNYQYDIIINNNGSLKDFEKEVRSFLMSEGLPLTDRKDPVD